MRMDVCLTNCQFLILTVRIIEGKKYQNVGKTCIHGTPPCWDSKWDQFWLQIVSQKLQTVTFLRPSPLNV